MQNSNTSIARPLVGLGWNRIFTILHALGGLVEIKLHLHNPSQNQSITYSLFATFGPWKITLARMCEIEKSYTVWLWYLLEFFELSKYRWKGASPSRVLVRMPDNAWWSGATANVTTYLEVGSAREACHLSVAPVTTGAFQAWEGEMWGNLAAGKLIIMESGE